MITHCITALRPVTHVFQMVLPITMQYASRLTNKVPWAGSTLELLAARATAPANAALRTCARHSMAVMLAADNERKHAV